MTSPVISDDPTPIDSDRPIELAPSEVALDEPSLARTVGMIAAGFAFIGGLALLAHHLNGPKLISKSMSLVLVVLGAVGMMFHAAKDGDQEVRRTYGFLGYGLVVLAIGFTIFNSSGFPFEILFLFCGICYLNFFVRNETERSWRQPVFLVFGLLSALIGVVLIGSVFFSPSTIAGVGTLGGLIAIGTMCGLISHLGSDTIAGRRAGFALGWTGLGLFAISVLRSLAVDNSPAFFVPYGLLASLIGLIAGLVALAILSDNSFIVMTRRELTAYFYSPIAYLVLIGMTLIGLLNFYEFVEDRLSEAPLEPIVRWFLIGNYPIVATICIVPAITMRLLSEEKRTGTYEVLLTLPVSETTVVLSKFVAALIFFVFLWIPWGLYLISLRIELDRPFDYRPLLSFYFALLITGSAFVSMGLFFSSLTRNQIIAAVLTFSGMLALTFLYGFAQLQSVGEVWRMIFLKLSYLLIWFGATGGKLPIHDLLLYFSLTIFWLFLTVKSLEMRKWT